MPTTLSAGQASCMESITKLQKAGRAFLLRLVAEHGLAGAARVLRVLADESEQLTVVPLRQ